MTRRQVWQYGCDYCGKRNLSAGHMRHHEKRCTRNPQRECGMCKVMEEEQKPLAFLAEFVDFRLPDQGLSQLKEAASGCPACILSTLLLCGAHKPGYGLVGPAEYRPEGGEFDFKHACKVWWDEFNDARNEMYGYY